MKKRKFFIILIIIIVILILAGLWYRIFLWESNAKNLNFYEKDGEIWKVDLSSNKEEKIFDGIEPAVSHDKKKLVYTYKSNFSDENRFSEIHIFDIRSNKDKVLKRYNDDFAIAVYDAIWSPDDKYLLIDKGTSPIRAKMIINSKTGENVISFSAYSSFCEWLNNNEVVFNEPQGSWNFRPYGAGKGSGISVINLNGQKRILKQATLNKDYSVVKILNENIYFCERTVKETTEDNGDWINPEKINKTYWFMDKDGNNLTQIDKIN